MPSTYSRLVMLGAAPETRGSIARGDRRLPRARPVQALAARAHRRSHGEGGRARARAPHAAWRCADFAGPARPARAPRAARAQRGRGRLLARLPVHGRGAPWRAARSSCSCTAAASSASTTTPSALGARRDPRGLYARRGAWWCRPSRCAPGSRSVSREAQRRLRAAPGRAAAEPAAMDERRRTSCCSSASSSRARACSTCSRRWRPRAPRCPTCAWCARARATAARSRATPSAWASPTR